MYQNISTIASRPLIIFTFLFCLVWLPSLHHGFINVDTPWLVINNPILSNPTWDHVQMIFLDFSFSTRIALGAEYLPIRDLTVMLDFLLFGNHWMGHHIQSLLWYYATCLLVLKIGNELFKNPKWALIATLMYMIHPTHSESVAWLANRKDVVSSTFLLWAIWCYLKNASRFSVPVLVLLAYWSKNTAIVAGPLLMVISLSIHKDNPFNIKWLISWLPTIAVSLIGLKITFYVGTLVGMFAKSRGSTAFETWTITTQVWLKYCQNFLNPTKLSLFYPEPTAIELMNFQHLLGGSSIFILLSLNVYFLLKKSKMAFFFAIIFWGFLPVSQITPIQNLMADRYLFLPSLGMVWILTELCRQVIDLGQLQKWKNTLQLVLFIYAIFWTVQCQYRNYLFQDSIRIWTDMTQKEPLDARGWSGLAGIYMEQGNLEAASQCIDNGLNYLPNQALLLQSLGQINLKKQQFELAISYFQLAWAMDKDLRKSANNQIILLQKLKELASAKEIALELVAIHPLYDQGWNSLANVAIEERDFKTAKWALDKSIQINRYNPTTLSNLGTVAYLEKNHTEAQYWWRAVLQLEPENAYALNGLQAIEKQNMPSQ